MFNFNKLNWIKSIENNITSRSKMYFIIACLWFMNLFSFDYTVEHQKLPRVRTMRDCRWGHLRMKISLAVLRDQFDSDFYRHEVRATNSFPRAIYWANVDFHLHKLNSKFLLVQNCLFLKNNRTQSYIWTHLDD